VDLVDEQRLVSVVSLRLDGSNSARIHLVSGGKHTHVPQVVTMTVAGHYQYVEVGTRHGLQQLLGP
jgi:hypothetical protein